jgi:hypothetical protein
MISYRRLLDKLDKAALGEVSHEQAVVPENG